MKFDQSNSSNREIDRFDWCMEMYIKDTCPALHLNAKGSSAAGCARIDALQVSLFAFLGSA